MPIYEYICNSCDARFETLARAMSAAGGKIECPKCRSTKTARALSVFAVNAASTKSNAASPSRMCGRCGGPGPCASD